MTYKLQYGKYLEIFDKNKASHHVRFSLGHHENFRSVIFEGAARPRSGPSILCYKGRRSAASSVPRLPPAIATPGRHYHRFCGPALNPFNSKPLKKWISWTSPKPAELARALQKLLELGATATSWWPWLPNQATGIGLAAADDGPDDGSPYLTSVYPTCISLFIPTVGPQPSLEAGATMTMTSPNEGRYTRSSTACRPEPLPSALSDVRPWFTTPASPQRTHTRSPRTAPAQKSHLGIVGSPSDLVSKHRPTIMSATPSSRADCARPAWAGGSGGPSGSASAHCYKGMSVAWPALLS